MPPRIPSRSQALLLNCTEVCSSSSIRPSPLLSQTAAATTARLQCQQQTSSFSTTQPREITRQRKDFWRWLRTSGKAYRNPSGGPKYLQKYNSETDVPFPTNPEFKSQPVLSESARELIWKNVMEDGQPIKAVSARYSVDMRRVAAVLRMKAIEKQWKSEGKPLAIPYAKAVLNMVPTNTLESIPHEPINDIHVHSYTMQQVFYPASESRQFTRADAAKAFGEQILPVDAKMRIPELLGLEKELINGVPRQTAEENFMQAAMKSESEIANRERVRARAVEERKTRVDSGRFEFRFEDVNVDSSGKDGRSRRGVGWKYGVPFTDRKRGLIKIPTKVE